MKHLPVSSQNSQVIGRYLFCYPQSERRVSRGDKTHDKEKPKHWRKISRRGNGSQVVCPLHDFFPDQTYVTSRNLVLVKDRKVVGKQTSSVNVNM